MSDAVFKDDDGRWTWMCGTLELDLGSGNAGRYMYARDWKRWRESRQVCSGGLWLGNTLMWPGTIVGYGPEVTSKLGHKFQVPIYEAWEDDRLLNWLGRALHARTYKSRANYERHYVKPIGQSDDGSVQWKSTD